MALTHFKYAVVDQEGCVRFRSGSVKYCFDYIKRLIGLHILACDNYLRAFDALRAGLSGFKYYYNRHCFEIKRFAQYPITSPRVCLDRACSCLLFAEQVRHDLKVVSLFDDWEASLCHG